MVRAKTAIIRRLSPKMNIVRRWMVCFDLPMPHEVFDLLNKEILGLTRVGIEAEDTPGAVTITSAFSSLRRLSHLFEQFEDFGGFREQLGKGKGEAKLNVNSKNKETMVYKSKEEILRAKFFLWMQEFVCDIVRISQQWIEDAMLNHRVTSISLIPHWQKPVNLCAWTVTKKTDCLPWIMASIPYFLLRTYKSVENIPTISAIGLMPWRMNRYRKTIKFTSYMEIILKTSPTQRFLSFWRNHRNQITVFVGHLSTSFTTWISPIFHNFWRNCRNRSVCWAPFIYLLYHLNLVILANTVISLIFRKFLEKSQKLQKWQFLLGTLLPLLTFVLIKFSKNCDFSNFLQFLEKSQKLHCLN